MEHKLGNIYRLNDCVYDNYYMLCQTFEGRITFISLHSGNRWSDMVDIRFSNIKGELTDKDLNKLCGSSAKCPNPWTFVAHSYNEYKSHLISSFPEEMVLPIKVEKKNITKRNINLRN
jgi:hypothetical protein